MCNVLNIPKSTYYYHENAREKEELKAEEADIKRIFKESRNNYGTRKIKIELKKQMNESCFTPSHWSDYEAIRIGIKLHRSPI